MTARPKPRPGHRGARAQHTTMLADRARDFLAEGATVELWADIWAALRRPDGRVICLPNTVLEQAREALREGLPEATHGADPSRHRNRSRSP